MSSSVKPFSSKEQAESSFTEDDLIADYLDFRLKGIVDRVISHYDYGTNHATQTSPPSPIVLDTSSTEQRSSADCHIDVGTVFCISRDALPEHRRIVVRLKMFDQKIEWHVKLPKTISRSDVSPFSFVAKCPFQEPIGVVFCKLSIKVLPSSSSENPVFLECDNGCDKIHVNKTGNIILTAMLPPPSHVRAAAAPSSSSSTPTSSPQVSSSRRKGGVDNSSPEPKSKYYEHYAIMANNLEQQLSSKTKRGIVRVFYWQDILSSLQLKYDKSFSFSKDAIKRVVATSNVKRSAFSYKPNHVFGVDEKGKEAVITFSLIMSPSSKRYFDLDEDTLEHDIQAVGLLPPSFEKIPKGDHVQIVAEVKWQKPTSPKSK